MDSGRLQAAAYGFMTNLHLADWQFTKRARLEMWSAQSKPARGERKVFSVDAQRQLWAKAASTAADGFPGGSDTYVQVGNIK